MCGWRGSSAVFYLVWFVGVCFGWSGVSLPRSIFQAVADFLLWVPLLAFEAMRVMCVPCVAGSMVIDCWTLVPRMVVCRMLSFSESGCSNTHAASSSDVTCANTQSCVPPGLVEPVRLPGHMRRLPSTWGFLAVPLVSKRRKKASSISVSMSFRSRARLLCSSAVRAASVLRLSSESRSSRSSDGSGAVCSPVELLSVVLSVAFSIVSCKVTAHLLGARRHLVLFQYVVCSSVACRPVGVSFILSSGGCLRQVQLPGSTALLLPSSASASSRRVSMLPR